MRVYRAILLLVLSFSTIKASSQADSAIHFSLQLVGSPLFSGANGTLRAGALFVIGDKYIRLRGGFICDPQTQFIVTRATSQIAAIQGKPYDTASFSSLIVPVMIDYSFIVREKWYSYLSLEVIHFTFQTDKPNSSNISHYNYFRYGTFFSRLGLGFNWSCTSKISFFGEPFICYSPSSYYNNVILPGNASPPIFLYGVLFGISLDLFKYNP
jgi:hypothetical protein